MSAHLSPEEFVDCAAGTLDAERAAHVDRCERCRAAERRFAALVADVQSAGPVPEPSPFFWEHFSTRVRAATAPMGIAPEPRWAWRAAWRPVAATLAVAAVVLFAVVRRAPSPARDALAPSAVSDASSAASVIADAAPVASAASLVTAAAPVDDDEAQWNQMVDAAARMSRDDVYQVASSVPALGDGVLLDDLTPAERAVFVRLLQSEMDGAE